MLKLIAVSRKRPGLTRADYQRYIEFYHGSIARMDRVKIRSYIQNHVIDGAFGSLSDETHAQVADRDAAVEIYFDNFRDMITTLEPAEPGLAAEDGKFFADERNSITIMGEEEEIAVSHPIPGFNPGLGVVKNVGGMKVMLFLMRDETVYPEDYYKYWREAHAAALAGSSYADTQLRRCVVTRRSRLNDNDAAARKHFKMVDPPVYDMAVSLWYDSMEQAGAFREYLDGLQKFDKTFVNWSKSFFIYTKQIVIIRDTPAAA